MFRSHSLEFLRERLWFALLSVFTLLILILYTWFGSDAFFITGPSLLFFIALTQFPRFLIWKWNLHQERGPQYLRILKAVEKINTHNSPLPQFYITANSPIKSNVCFLATGKTHWFIADPAFIKSLSDEHLHETLEAAQELFFHTVTQRASLLSALQYFLFFLPWSHHRGNELCFYSLRKNIVWTRLLFEQCVTPKNAEKVWNYMAPVVAFPVLTNYNPKTYYSLYVYLRDQWLEQTQNTHTLNEQNLEKIKTRDMNFEKAWSETPQSAPTLLEDL